MSLAGQMEASRQTTVLFADVTGSMKLYETAGDALAAEAIGRCLEKLRLSAEATGGRVVKTMGDSVMALFSSPGAAASAAASMQVAIARRNRSAIPADRAASICRACSSAWESPGSSSRSSPRRRRAYSSAS
ncbi:MAG: hypothetical protein E6H38_05870 [Betaproteobacteria bacterium]|nr:MAG: hypothetical protein E6H38_05870 [Betaproteobacteria bacterium]